MKQQAEKTPTYFIDAGDAFFNSPYPDQTNADKKKAIAEAILKSYNAMDCQVMNIGSYDLAYGKDFIMQLVAVADFPMISANTRDADSKDLLFEPTYILNTEDMSIGFIGVTNGNTRQSEFLFSDPVAAVVEQIAELKGQVDLIVVLANVVDNYESRLANEVEGIDFLIRSNTGRVNRVPQKVNQTHIIRNGNRGKYAGVLHIIHPDPVAQLRDVSQHLSRISFTENRLEAMARDIPEDMTLEEYYQGDATKMELILKLKKEKQDKLELIERQTNRFSYEAVALDTKVADDPEILPLVIDYYADGTKPN